MLVSLSYDMTSCFWDPQTKQLVAATREGFPTAFSPDDNQMIFKRESSTDATWGYCRVMRPPELRIIKSDDAPGDPNIFYADFSPDGRTLAVMKSDGPGRGRGGPVEQAVPQRDRA